MLFETPHDLVVWAYFVPLTWALASDVMTFRIPNRICLTLLALYPLHVLTSSAAVDWPVSLGLAAFVFLVGTVMFWRGWMGGGDVKLMAAMALWSGPQAIVGFLLVTSLVGGALAGLTFGPMRTVLAVARMHAGFDAVIEDARKLPYGVAIALGGMTVGAMLLRS